MPGRARELSINPETIRPVRTPMSLVRSEPSDAGFAFLRETLARQVPHAEFREVGDRGAVGAFDDDRLVGFADPSSGQTHLLPLLETLTPARSHLPAARAGVRALLAEQGHLFADDVSKVAAATPRQLYAGTGSRRGVTRRPEAMLATVPIRRSMGRVPVFGPGSAASASFGAQGLVGLGHRWGRAALTDQRIQPDPIDRVAERIREAAAPLLEDRAVTLTDATPVYYDDGEGLIQPAYRVRLVLDPDDKEAATPGRMVGYLPIGDQPGALPPLVRPADPAPGDAGDQPGRAPKGGPTVGRYVVRKDNAGWVASANAFMSTINAFSFFLGGFADAQYYWAEPRLFTTQKNSFVNAVNIALTEVHGNWNLFTTLQNNADYVYLNQIPAPGYGGAGGVGSLAYWILHSCEVIPTATDETTSFDVWWNIFGGLHAAVGYRTEMWINDQVSSLFGLLIGLGAPVVSTWLHTVITDNDYQSGDTYYDDNRQMTEPMGRPSAIAVSGHGDDTARMVAPLPRPSSLTEWWYGN